MSIYLVTGPPGTGKTWFSLRTMFEALKRGKWVASNVELQPGWSYQLAKQHWFTRLRGRKALQRLADRFEERTFVSTSLHELLSLRIPGCGRCRGCAGETTACRREGRGLVVLDEAHEWLNARTWDQDDTGKGLSKAEAMLMRMAVIKFFSHHRKLGWDVYLVTQNETRLDVQVRNNFEYHVHLKNMRKHKVFGLFPLTPFNFFVAITTWHATGNERVAIKTYLLNKLANLYDTMASPTLRPGEEDATLIHLPLTPAQRAARAAGEPLPTAQPAEEGAERPPAACAPLSVPLDAVDPREGP